MILKGDCIKVMKAIKPNSVDAIVCDPPYGLEFMGKEWDKLEKIPKGYIECKGEKSIIKKKMPRFHQTVEHNSSMQIWHTQWLTEAYKVLKPGGSMLVMGGTRTSHRLACAIEDSGFIIKDTLMWLYGSGFPKAQDLGKMIDKRMGAERNPVTKEIEIKDLFRDEKGEVIAEGQGAGTKGNTFPFEHTYPITNPLTDKAQNWDGFKVGGIKPAYEPIIWAVKPPEGSYVDNVLKWGVGAVNVDECRIGFKDNEDIGDPKRFEGLKPFPPEKGWNQNKLLQTDWDVSKGRFPANVILSHHPECVQVGMKRVKPTGGGNRKKEGKFGNIFHYPGPPDKGYSPDGYEQVESWDCHPDCAVRLLDEQSGMRPGCKSPSQAKPLSKFRPNQGKYMLQGQIYPDNGGASRFFKVIDQGRKLLCKKSNQTRKNPERDLLVDSCKDEQKSVHFYNDSTEQDLNRFFYCAKASRGERNAGLDGMEEKELGHNRFDKCAKCGGYIFQNPDRNSACKCKEPQREHNKVRGNNHPTVKPIKLFEYLIKLVTREGQVILDPFMGSGTTAIAAHNTGRKCVGIEKEDEYLIIAKRRIDYWQSQPKQMEIRI